MVAALLSLVLLFSLPSITTRRAPTRTADCGVETLGPRDGYKARMEF